MGPRPSCTQTLSLLIILEQGSQHGCLHPWNLQVSVSVPISLSLSLSVSLWCAGNQTQGLPRVTSLARTQLCNIINEGTMGRTETPLGTPELGVDPK